MSCNGCRVLRKGCSDTCILRPCLQWIESSDAQGHATVFVAKFFGRAGLMGFISAVPESQRPALFQSLLYEACGRTVNPVFGAVGLLWGGNWQTCQAAVETVLKGGSLRSPSPSSMPSSCLPANWSFPAPFPSLTIPGKFPTPISTRVPTDMAVPLSNSLADSYSDRHNISLGIGLSEPSGQEHKEHFDGPNKAHEERILRQKMNQFPAWPKDRNFDNGNKIQPMFEAQKGDLDHEMREPKATANADLYQAHVVGASPRRVRARVEMATPKQLGPRERGHDDPSVPAHGAENLELDLTLKVKGGKGGQMVGNKRLSSPCESVNSEGSVTSLDSTPRDLARPASWTVEMSLMPPPLRKLLPLLQ